MRKVSVGIGLFVLLCLGHVESMTEAQMKNAVKLVRNVCQPKNKVTNEQIDGMHNGNFDGDRKAACYMNCALTMLKVMKDGKVDFDFIISQIALIPTKFQEPTKDSFAKCKNALDGIEEKCDAAYEFAKCFYNNNPEFYFLP